MERSAVQMVFSKAKEEEYLEWISSAVPWKNGNPFDPRKNFSFFNPISGKMTLVPISLLSRNILYLPTNSPGTGEHFVPVIFAVNGRYDVNYDESEHRFDSAMNYVSEDHFTRIDIFVCRQPDSKAGKRKS